MATACIGVIECVYQQQGWSEKYFLGDLTGGGLSTFLLKLQQLVWGRTAFFGTGCFVTFARVSSTNSAHDGLLCQLPYPIGPHPSWSTDSGPPAGPLAPPNDPDTVIQQRYETAAGNFWQRYYRCMPDSWVTNKTLDPALLAYLTPLPAGAAIGDMSPVGGLSHLAVCQTFWRYQIANTFYAKRTGLGQYNLSAFDFITFRQITEKKIGRPFGMSRGRRPKNLIS